MDSDDSVQSSSLASSLSAASSLSPLQGTTLRNTLLSSCRAPPPTLHHGRTSDASLTPLPRLSSSSLAGPTSSADSSHSSPLPPPKEPVEAPDSPLSTVKSSRAQSTSSRLTALSRTSGLSSPLSALQAPTPSSSLSSSALSSMESDDLTGSSPRQGSPAPASAPPHPTQTASRGKRKSSHASARLSDAKRVKTKLKAKEDQSIDADTSTGTATRGGGRSTSIKGKEAYNRARAQQAKVMAASSGDASEGQNSPEAPHSLGPCHQHRRFCGRPMLQCTKVRDKNQRCRLRFCDYALKIYYGLSRDDIISRGRDATSGDSQKVQVDLDPDEQCSASEAGYLFVCPRCTGTCDCSVCRHRRNLPPLAHTDVGHDMLAHAHAHFDDQTDGGEMDPPSTPAKGNAKGKVKPKTKARASAQSGAGKTAKTKLMKSKSKASKAKTADAEMSGHTEESISSDDEALASKMLRAPAAPKRKSLSKAQREAAAQDAEESDELTEILNDGGVGSDSDEPLSRPTTKGKPVTNGTARAKPGPKKATKGKATTTKGTKAVTVKAKSSTTKGKGVAKGKAAAAKDTKATPTKGKKSATQELPKIRPRPAVPAPDLQEPPLTGTVESFLPSANLFARMWIYEALVRFDAVPTPGLLLRRLDRFDDWNPRMLNHILEAVTACLSGTTLKALQTSAKPAFNGALPGVMLLVRAIRMLHSQPDALVRGEAWEAAREWLQAEGVVIEDLPNVEHNFAEDTEERMETPGSDTAFVPGTSRRVLTRAGRAKLNNVDVPRKNLREASYHSDDDLEEDQGDDDEDYDGVQSPEASDDENDDEKDDEQPESTSQRTRRGRSSRNSNETSLAAEQADLRRSSRARWPVLHSEVTSQAPSTTASVSRQNSTPALPSSARDSVGPEGAAEAQGSAEDVPHTPTPALEAPTPALEAPVPAPPFEQRVAILGALINDMVPRTNAARTDLIEAWNNNHGSEREARNDANKLKADHKEKMVMLNEKLSKETIQRYIEELGRKKQREQRNLAWQLLQRKVQLYSHLNRTKLRSGPLGTDVDGREYWHLTEFTEAMPKNTEGRWSWALYIYGKPFPHPTTIAKVKVKREANAGQQDVENGAASHPTPGPEAKAGSSSPTPGASGVTDRSAEIGVGGKPPSEGAPTEVMTEVDETAKIESSEEQAWAQENFVLETEPQWQMVNWPFWILKTIQYIRYRLSAVEMDEKRARELTKWQRAVLKSENEAVAAAPNKKSKIRASFSAAGAPSVAPGAGPRWAAESAAGIVGARTSGLAEKGSKNESMSDLTSHELAAPAAQLKIDALEEAARLTEAAYEEMRKARRTEVEELCHRLDQVLEYFMFHLGFVERSEVEAS